MSCRQPLALGMPPSLASTSVMPNKDRSFHEAPEMAGGEGWLYSEQQATVLAAAINRWASFKRQELVQ